MAVRRSPTTAAAIRPCAAVPLLLLMLPALAAAAREGVGIATAGPRAGPSPIDYEKEAKDVAACAMSRALPEAVTLVPSDSNTGVTVRRSVACFMKVVQNMAEEDEDTEEPEPGLEIPLAKVDSDSLSLIVEFAERKLRLSGPELEALNFSVVPRPLSGPLRETKSISEDDSAFMDAIAEDLDRLIRLTNAVNFVDSPPLLELCAARIAQMLIGKTPSEIREVFPEAFGVKKEVDVAA